MGVSFCICALLDDGITAIALIGAIFVLETAQIHDLVVASGQPVAGLFERGRLAAK
jgi:hypothetical protein